MIFTSKSKNLLLLLAILAVAVFFRLYKLDSIPPGLYPDVAINGNDALQTLRTGDFKLFYPENNGREGLIMWLDAASIYVFGISVFALKFPAAVAGVLTVWGVYLLGKQLFKRKNEAIPLLAAFFCAISFWHVNFSRIGFRAIFVPFCLVFCFYFLWRAFKENRIFLAAAAGIFFGLGFYTYTVFRLGVPLLLCTLAIWFFLAKFDKKTFIKIALAMLMATFFTALPIGIYFLGHTADFFGRAGQTSVFSSANPAYAFAQSLVLHLGMFNFYGDGNWRHNYPGSPELFWPIGLLFLAGICLISRRIAGALKTKEFDGEFGAYLFLLLWFVFMLMPGVLTIEGVPHALRVIGAIPAVMILSAVGGIKIYDWLTVKIGRRIAVAGAAILLIAVGIQGYCQYFIVWAQNPAVPYAFTAPYTDVADVASRMHADGYQTIIIVNEPGVAVPYPNGMPMPAQTVMYKEAANCYQIGGIISKLYCGAYSTYILPDDIKNFIVEIKTAAIPMRDDQSIFDQLAARFPNGQIKTENNIRYFETP